MRRAVSSLRDAGVNLRRSPAQALAIIVVSAISLALLGVSLLINSQIDLMKGYWYDRVEVSIFLSDDITDAQRSELGADLKADPEVQDVFFESRQQAFELFQDQFASSPELTSEVTVDQLPESYRVKLVDPEDFEVISATYSSTPGVDVVQDQRELLEDFFRILNGVRDAALVVALVQVATVLLLVANTVRIAALSRKRETRIMRLVGAPRAMIAAPFVLEGAIAGLLGGLASAGVLVGLKAYLVDGVFKTAETTLPLIGWESVWGVAGIVVVAGVVLSTFTSVLAILPRLKA
jgi:cell division transport system permease protein